MRNVFASLAAALLAAAPLFPAAAGPATNTIELPGQRADGSVLLPNGWSLRPAGTQVELGGYPVNIAVHPGGRFAAALDCGHGPHQLIIVDVTSAKVVSRTRLHEAFQGVEFSPDGKRLFCGGASDEVVHVFDFKEGQLSAAGDVALCNPEQRGIPCGLAVTADGRTLYAANVWGQYVSKVDLAARTNLLNVVLHAAAETPASFTGRAVVDADTAAATKRAEAQDDPVSPDAPFPYACRLDEKHGRLYVSLWAKASVAVLDLKTMKVVADWPTEEHPNEMALSKSKNLLYVANANRNTVSVISTADGKTVQTLSSSLSPAAPPGSTPTSLALSPDEKTLFVANACNNNIAVFDVSDARKGRSLGFIPVGWYPTSVRVTPDGRQLLVVNGKGLSSKANPRGPQPGKRNTPDTQSIAELFPGSMSIIDLPKGDEWDAKMAASTAQAYACAPQQNPDAASTAPVNFLPTQPGQSGPVKYCIYIIKENRTYDQVLGDMPQGNGDSNLCLFGEKVTPNHHELARDYVLYDNFYVNASVSADGHEWSMGAYATDFVEKTWPLNYGHGRSKKFPYPSEGHFPIAAPSSGYLWDRAVEAGVSYRSYGEFVSNGRTPADPATTQIAALKGHFDPMFRSFDLDYTDVKRAERFISELKRFESEGGMPRLQIVRLPNDHTSGASAGKPTPSASAADNDRGLGMLVDAVSHSRFWANTAIFVVEDDAQNGPDHVDAHRSVALLISPYTRGGGVDSTMYSTAGMLHTMELLLGLKPMTQFDSVATPMFHAFHSQPDTTPFNALPAGTDLNERNTALSWGGRASQKMDFTKEDAADDFLLNEIIWRSVRGADSPMPAPVHAAFVFTPPAGDDDD